MRNKIIVAVAVFVLAFTFSSTLLSVNAEGGKVQKTTVTTVEKEEKAVLNKKLQKAPQMQPQQNEVVSVKPLDLIENPDKYLNKKVKISASFDKFSILGLDYKPAMRSSENYITFLVQRPNVSNDIPLSELKNFLSRDMAEKFIDLNNGDVIEYTGTVFSSALGDAWVDVDSLTVIKKKEIKK